MGPFSYTTKMVVGLNMSKLFYYAEVHAKVVVDWVVMETESGEQVERYLIGPDAAGAIVRYLLTADSIEEAMDKVQEHAFHNYLEKGEVTDFFELDTEEVMSNPIAQERDFDLTDPDFFEIIFTGCYERSFAHSLRKFKRWIMGWF